MLRREYRAASVGSCSRVRPLVHGVTLIKLSQRQYGKTSRSPASVTATNAKHAMRAWACVKSRPSEAS